MKLKKCVAALLTTAIAAVSLVGCASPAPAGGGGGGAAPAAGGGAAAPARELIWSIGTADTGGTMYPVGASIASVINTHVDGIRVNVETSRGSPENAVNVQGGIVELGLATGDVVFQAINGTGQFEGEVMEDLRVIAALFSSVSSWIAMSASGMTMVSELDGANVAIGPEASATEIAALIAFEALGIEPRVAINIGLGDGAEEVADGVRDAAHGFAGLPIGGQLSVAQTNDSVFLGFTDAELDSILAINPSYHKTIIPAGTYPGQDEDVPTFGVKALLIAHASMDDEIAYQIAEALTGNVESLVTGHAALREMEDPHFIANDIPVPLHPGAERFFRNAGMIR